MQENDVEIAAQIARYGQVFVIPAEDAAPVLWRAAGWLFIVNRGEPVGQACSRRFLGDERVAECGKDRRLVDKVDDVYGYLDDLTGRHRVPVAGAV